MDYDFLRGRGDNWECHQSPTFLFAAQPPLSAPLITLASEEIGLFAYEYPDSSEFMFDDESVRDRGMERLKIILEANGDRVRVLDRVVELGAEADMNISLFEESTILH